MSHFLLTVLISLLIGYWIGWSDAHYTVAKECRMLGAFYVGKTVFKCVEAEDKP